MEILLHPHPALRWKSQPVRQINAELRSAIDEMFDLMYQARGVGLAANQVGLPFRFFIINVTADPEERDEEFVFINPEITRRKGSAEGEEGCLSLPEIYGQVRRAESIVVEAYDLKGQLFEMQLEDLPARCVLHEYDHLDGVMFFDRMAEAARREIETKIADAEFHFRRRQNSGDLPTDEELLSELKRLESSGTLAVG
jgi:peptide deformylase